MLCSICPGFVYVVDRLLLSEHAQIPEQREERRRAGSLLPYHDVFGAEHFTPSAAVVIPRLLPVILSLSGFVLGARIVTSSI